MSRSVGVVGLGVRSCVLVLLVCFVLVVCLSCYVAGYFHETRLCFASHIVCLSASHV